jgi:hypothetical protein
MKNPFRDRSVELTCPACRNKFQEKITILENSPKLSCPACRKSIQIDGAKLKEGMGRVDQSFSDLSRTLRKFGKR